MLSGDDTDGEGTPAGRGGGLHMPHLHMPHGLHVPRPHWGHWEQPFEKPQGAAAAAAAAGLGVGVGGAAAAAGKAARAGSTPGLSTISAPIGGFAEAVLQPHLLQPHGPHAPPGGTHGPAAAAAPAAGRPATPRSLWRKVSGAWRLGLLHGAGSGGGGGRFRGSASAPELAAQAGPGQLGPSTPPAHGASLPLPPQLPHHLPFHDSLAHLHDRLPAGLGGRRVGGTASLTRYSAGHAAFGPGAGGGAGGEGGEGGEGAPWRPLRRLSLLGHHDHPPLDPAARRQLEAEAEAKKARRVVGCRVSGLGFQGCRRSPEAAGGRGQEGAPCVAGCGVWVWRVGAASTKMPCVGPATSSARLG